MSKDTIEIKGPEDIPGAYMEYGSLKAISRHCGLTWHRVRRFYLSAVERGLMDQLPYGNAGRGAERNVPGVVVDGSVHTTPVEVFDVPQSGVKRYILTSAQNNTHVHDEAWNNLLAYASYLDAEILVARYTYARTGFGAVGDKAESIRQHNSGARYDTGARARIWFDKRLEPYWADRRIELAPGLLWCGEVNIIPTMRHPLAGLDAYTGRASAVFPHAAMAMRSLPAPRGRLAKLLYTTGTITQRNYIQRRLGFIAEHNHVYGALIVEVDSAGNWFVRQINCDASGAFQDLTCQVDNQHITSDAPVEVIHWGDIHVDIIDQTVAELAWGDGGMLDTLRPRIQFFNDLIDFRTRTHHDASRPHRMFRKHVAKVESVHDELIRCRRFLALATRYDCETVVVDSNHHHHIGRWLEEQDGRKDPVNAESWFALNALAYARLRERERVNYLEIAMAYVGVSHQYLGGAPLRYLDDGESYIVCPGVGGGIECGMHGHDGPNGSRGGAASLSKLGRRICIGHSHSSAILGGVFVSGTCSELDPAWASGPRSWSHSHAVIYPNGKRAIVTMFGGKWRADMQAIAPREGSENVR